MDGFFYPAGIGFLRLWRAVHGAGRLFQDGKTPAMGHGRGMDLQYAD
ncbi:MAG: hypothetical protein K9K81_12650 [Desulfobacteraceae bacterium]|nr:hypothetical protein [Desulfobacteraceae bacterium]